MKLKNKVGMAYDICLENRKKFYIHLLAAYILQYTYFSYISDC